MNTEIVSLLTELADIADILGDVYREKAFRTAIVSIKKLDWSIKDNPARLAEKIPGIGDGIKNRLLEWIKTGSIADLEAARNDPRVRAHFVLSRIMGVGPATVQDWIKQNIYTLSDLRKAVSRGDVKLNKTQQLGLKYYDDLNQRIPRDEVTSLGNKIKQICMVVEPSIIFTIAGSYRRGSATSGDVDILIASRVYRKDILSLILNILEADPNFIDVTSAGRERLTFLYKSTRVRQIDILHLPFEEYYAGLLYFTGDWGFNEVMRGHARKMGFRLNQRGLYKLFGNKARLVRCESEEAIFAALKLKYIEPSQRNVSSIQKIITADS